MSKISSGNIERLTAKKRQLLDELYKTWDSPLNQRGELLNLQQLLNRENEIRAMPDEPTPETPRGITLDSLQELATNIGRSMKDFVLWKTDPLADRLKDLETRLAEVEQRKFLNYREVWSESEQYNEQDVVTDGGSMWAARRSTRARPGTSSDWVLCVKHGRDAR